MAGHYFYDIMQNIGGDPMYKNCKTDISAQRQKHIAQCLLDMIAKESYEDITITELCQQAGVPRNTFYRYFANKEAVLKYLLGNSLREMLQKVVQSYHSSEEREMIYHITNWLRFYKEQERVWALFDDKLHGILIGQVVAHYGSLLDPINKLDFRNQQTKGIIFYAYGMQGILDVWRHFGYEQSEEEVAVQLYNIVRNPIMDFQATVSRTEAFLSEQNKQTYYAE